MKGKSDHLNRSISAAVRWSISIAGLLSISIGLFWLVAWLTGAVAQLSAPGTVTVKTNMALAQLLAGSALLLLWPENVRGIRLTTGTIFALIVFLIGSLTLSQNVFGWNLHIDQILAAEPPHALATASPNRIGPPGSISLTLVGTALLCLALRRRTLTPYLGLATCMINFVPLVGFLYGIHQFYEGRATGIAWPTVAVLVSLGIGLILAQSESGPIRLLLQRDAGGMLLRRMLPAAFLVPLVLGFFRVQGERMGLYDTPMGTGMLMIVLILVFSSLLWMSARRLSRSSTAQKAAEEQLQGLALFPNENPNPVMRVSSTGELLYSNPAGEVMLLCRRHLEPGLPETLLTAAVDALEAGEMREMDIECAGRCYSFVLAPIRNKEYVNLYGRDVTKRKLAEEALNSALQELDVRAEELESMNEELAVLNEDIQATNEELRMANEELNREAEERRRSEAKYRDLFSNMSEEVHFWRIIRDDQGQIRTWMLVDANPPTLRTWGRTIEEIAGKTADEIFGPGSTEHSMTVVRKIMSEDKPHSYEDYFPHLDKYFRYTSVPLGEYFITTGADITAVKKANQALLQKEAELEEAQRVAHLGNWSWNAKNDSMTGSVELLHIYGLDPDTQRMPPFKAQRGVLYPVESWERLNAAMQETMRTGVSYEIDLQALHNGDPIWITASSEVVRDADGSATGLVGIVQDITERKVAEEALRESEAHKIEFFRRTIMAATHGKLIIAEKEEVESIAGPTAATVNIQTMLDAMEARHVAGQVAVFAGMEQGQIHRLMSAVGEATSNAWKHAGGGVMSVHHAEDALLVMVADKGPGIDALNLPDVALTAGFSTVGTGGLGYKLIIAASDRVYLATGLDGTTVASVVSLHEQTA